MRPRCVSGNVCKRTSMCYQPGGEIMASLLAVVTIVLINGCFHNGPVMCPMSVIMAQGVYWAEGQYTDFEDHYYRPRTHNRAIMKTPFS